MDDQPVEAPAPDQTKEDILRLHPDAVDLDNLPKQTHNWVKRGIVLSCEGARHPSHRHFFRH